MRAQRLEEAAEHFGQAAAFGSPQLIPTALFQQGRSLEGCGQQAAAVGPLRQAMVAAKGAGGAMALDTDFPVALALVLAGLGHHGEAEAAYVTGLGMLNTLAAAAEAASEGGQEGARRRSGGMGRRAELLNNLGNAVLNPLALALCCWIRRRVFDICLSLVDRKSGWPTLPLLLFQWHPVCSGTRTGRRRQQQRRREWWRERPVARSSGILQS